MVSIYMHQQTPSNLRVMISAGASGIGLAIAKAFLKIGAQVQICDISVDAINSIKKDLPEIGTFIANISNPHEVKSWFDYALAELGGLDVLVNNAGIAGPTAKITDITETEWDQVMDINVKSQFLCCKYAIPALRLSSHGTIINLSSVAGRLGYPLRSPYAASKWAIIGMTQSLALELGNDNITVNAILPGIVDSERARIVTKNKANALGISEEEMTSRILANVALHQKVPLDNVANTAIFLASEAGRSFTGQNFNICAGIQTLL